MSPDFSDELRATERAEQYARDNGFDGLARALAQVADDLRAQNAEARAARIEAELTEASVTRDRSTRRIFNAA